MTESLTMLTMVAGCVASESSSSKKSFLHVNLKSVYIYQANKIPGHHIWVTKVSIVIILI